MIKALALAAGLSACVPMYQGINLPNMAGRSVVIHFSDAITDRQCRGLSHGGLGCAYIQDPENPDAWQWFMPEGQRVTCVVWSNGNKDITWHELAHCAEPYWH